MTFISRDKYIDVPSVAINTNRIDNTGTSTRIFFQEVFRADRSFPIGRFEEGNTLALNADSSLFHLGQTLTVTGTDSNDGVYIVSAINQGLGELTLQLAGAAIRASLSTGVVHIPIDVSINHNLGTQEILYQVTDSSTGKIVNINAVDKGLNELRLSPAISFLGELQIIIIPLNQNISTTNQDNL